MTLLHITTRHDTYPDQFHQFVAGMRRQIEAKGMIWHVPLNQKGIPIAGRDWDLRILNGSHQRHAAGTAGFMVDSQVRDLAIHAGWPAANLPNGAVLSECAQDFIKSIIANRCLSGRTADSSQIIAKSVRRLLSSTVVPPYKLAREHFEAFLSLKAWSEKSKADLVVVAKVIDEHLLSEHCPVQPRVASVQQRELLPSLQARERGDKLPDKEALFELTRIVFQETPKTFNDAVFFSVFRLLILTGLRISELISLPDDCLVWDEHLDIVTGKNAATVGGIGRSLRLRYYAAKQRGGSPDMLVERYYFVPSRLERLVESTVSEILLVTAPLRAILKNQSSHPENYPNSDIREFKTSAGLTVGNWQTLFLTLGTVTPFPLGEPLADDAAISTPFEPRIYSTLGRSIGNGSLSFFQKYGSTSEAMKLSVQPHSLRHLMNTELFRQNVPDTAITHQFGRVSVTQSYEYDHRSLAEKLKFVQLPAVASSFVPAGTTQELVAKMVVSGFASSSHLGQSFKRIQTEHGDVAAFAYLAANSDGFHVTPYGFCTNSFSMNPCARHLKCFDGCKHFAASGIPEHRVALEDLRERLVAMRCAADAKPLRTIGRANQVRHAEKLIKGVEAALGTQPNHNVFANGIDYASPNHKDVLA